MRDLSSLIGGFCVKFWRARVFLEKSQKYINIIFQIFPGYPEIPKTYAKNYPSPPEPSPWSRPPAARISRIVETRKNTISNISRIIENVGDFNLQYFQDSGNNGDFVVHIFIFISYYFHIYFIFLGRNPIPRPSIPMILQIIPRFPAPDDVKIECLGCDVTLCRLRRSDLSMVSKSCPKSEKGY